MNEEDLRKLLLKESCPDEIKNRVKNKIKDQMNQDATKDLAKDKTHESIKYTDYESAKYVAEEYVTQEYTTQEYTTKAWDPDTMNKKNNDTNKVTYIVDRKPGHLTRRYKIIKIAVAAACICLMIGITSLVLSQKKQQVWPTQESESITPMVTPPIEEEDLDFMYDLLDGATAIITGVDPNAVMISYGEYMFILPMEDTSDYQLGDSFEIIPGATLSQDEKKRDAIISDEMERVRNRFRKDGFAVPETGINQGPSNGYTRTDIIIDLGSQMQIKLGVFDVDIRSKSYQFIPNENYVYDGSFSLDILANHPDVNGRIESKYLPDRMQPGSVIQYVDDNHYAIISGEPYEYSPETLLAKYQAKALAAQICALNQITMEEDTLGKARMLVTYAQDGGISHTYDFQRFLGMEKGWIDNEISIESDPHVEMMVDGKGNTKANFNLAQIKVVGQVQFEKINQTIQTFIDETVAKGVESVQYYDSLEYTIGVDCPSFEFSSEYVISYNYNGLLQVQFSGYEYTGGVHPNTWLKSFLFDLATGEEIDLSQLVSVEEETFKEHIYSLFEQEKIKAEEDNEDVSFNGMDLEAARKLINFNMKYYLTQEGITFYFEPYEVHCYAAGYVSLLVDYQDMIFQ